jgi:FlaA1/EpsC-like NDP-sugar epimerase
MTDRLVEGNGTFRKTVNFPGIRRFMQKRPISGFAFRIGSGMKQTIQFALLDIIITFAAYIATYTIRLLSLPLDSNNSFLLIGIAAGITPVVFYMVGVYHRLWERTSGHGITVIIKAVALITGTVMFLNFIPSSRPLPFSVILVSSSLSLGGFIAIRYRSRIFSGMSWRWRAIWHHEFPIQKVPVLIVGAGEAGQMLALRLKHHFPGNHYAVVGFIDDNPEKQNMYIEGCRVLGERHSIPQVVKEHNISLIVVAVHNIGSQDFRDILANCEQTNAQIKVIPDILALMKATNNQTLLRDVQLEDMIGRTATKNSVSIDLAPVMGKVILVTGAAGSIGSELARQLVTYQPKMMVLLDNNESNLYELELELIAKFPDVRLVTLLGDITQRDSLRPAFQQYRPQVIFHAAAYKHVPMMERYPEEALRVNIGGTRNLAELAYEYGVERFVLISTDKAINPSSIMGASKRVCERLLHAFAQQCPHRTLFTSVRFGNVLGSRGSVVPIFAHQIENGGPVTITHPDMTRYFMSISEAVTLVIHAACLTEGGDVFMLKMGEVVRIVDLAERMIRLRGLRPGVDIPIEFTGIRSGEKLHEELHDDADNPIRTQHPAIMKVAHWRDFEGSALFFKKLDHLTSKGDVLSNLLDLSQVNQQPVPITNEIPT